LAGVCRGRTAGMWRECGTADYNLVIYGAEDS